MTAGGETTAFAAGGAAGGRRVCVWLWAGMLVLPLLSGCATYRDSMQQVDRALVARRPDLALKALEPLRGGHSEALYLLDKGMILRMQGDYQGSIAAFERAKHLMEYLEATSVTETAGALTLSENLRSYQGELYERLLLHVYQALNYLQLDRRDAALVEVQQIDLLLRRLYPFTDAAPHGGDAFARYFSALVYEDLGQWSDAMIAYRQAYQAYRAEGVPDAAMPRDLQLSLCRFADYLGLQQELDGYKQRFAIDSWPPVIPSGDPSGELVFVFSNGLAPRKRARSAVVQNPADGHFYTLSLPYLQRRRPAAARAELVVGGQTADTWKVESIARDAEQALSAAMPKLIADDIARNVAREALAKRADKKQQGMGAVLSFLGAVVDQPDTRIWDTLPDDIQLARLRLPPGRYDLEVRLQGPEGGVVATRIFRDVSIRPGRMSFVTWHWVSD